MPGLALARAATFLNTHYRDWPSVGAVLEAGGGSFTHFPLPPCAALIALDISPGQLQRNADAGLCICADLHQLPVAAGKLGAVFCFNVIEHLARPDLALPQLCRALAPGGLLVLGYPERASLKALVTRATPIGFHRWYYRVVVGKKDRGDGHFDAFPTVFHPLVSSYALHHALDPLGMEVLYLDRYDGARDYQIVGAGIARHLAAIPYYLAGALLAVLSAGRWQPLRSDALLIARKRPGTSLD